MMRAKVLSIYLWFVVVWQVLVYFGDGSGFHGHAYLDPRIGFVTYETAFQRELWLGPLAWLSAVVLAGLAGAMFVKPRAAWIYVFVEPLLSLPSVIFFVSIARTDISPAHGLSVGELFIPVLVFAICSVIPWLWAVFQLLPTKTTSGAEARRPDPGVALPHPPG